MDAIEQAIQFLQTYERLGSRALQDGTLLIARAPHIAPEAWLHQVFGPLAEDRIQRMEEQLDRSLPTDYRRMLYTCNGLSEFHALSI